MAESIAALAKRYGIRPDKKYGQNFIFDSSLCDKIVARADIGTGADLLEIGPGVGGLTFSLLKTAPASLTLVEKDRRCLPLLRDAFKNFPEVDISEGDALFFSLEDLSLKVGGKIDIVSNLPYNVGTPLTINFLKSGPYVRSATVTLQKEVVSRICADPGSKDYGRLSVLASLLAERKKLFEIAPEAFHPAPKVHSAVVRLAPRDNGLCGSLVACLEKTTNLVFRNRRKTLRASFSKNPAFLEAFGKLSIDSSMRPENLTPAEYLSLASYFLDKKIKL